MKKIVYTAAIFCLLAAFISCKSTKTSKKSSEKEASAPAVEATPEENSENKGEAALNAESSSEKTDSKIAETEAKDFTGWIKSSKKNLKESYGKIQIRTKSGIGSYTISALTDEGKTVPVLSTANEYVSNAFFLKTSKKIYNLVTDSSILAAARRTTDGIMLMYEIPSVAQVTVSFSCFASEKKQNADMIKVTVSIKNISNRNDDFVFKSILDTTLGESAAHHFYTWEDVPVKNEVLYRTFQNQKWFVSKNVNAMLQLFFSGADCTVPELVALANYSTLEKNIWEPDMLSYRVFDTVLSYNNSAVCAIWKPIKLAPSESGKLVFYMALSADGLPAKGEKYIYSKEFADKAAEKPASDKALELISSDAGAEEETELIEDGVTELGEEEVLVSEEPEEAAEIPTVDFYIKNMTKEQLSPEYIQSLLDRIAALEEDSPSLNRQELLQLNAELDAILTYLRQ